MLECVHYSVSGSVGCGLGTLSAFHYLPVICCALLVLRVQLITCFRSACITWPLIACYITYFRTPALVSSIP